MTQCRLFLGDSMMTQCRQILTVTNGSSRLRLPASRVQSLNLFASMTARVEVSPLKLAKRFALNLRKKCKICSQCAQCGEKKFFTAKNRNSYKNSPLNSPLILQIFISGKVILKTCKSSVE